MSTEQTGNRASTPATIRRRILVIAVTSAIAMGASVGTDRTPRTSSIIPPDHLVEGDGGGRVASARWPDHLVEGDGGGRVASVPDADVR